MDFGKICIGWRIVEAVRLGTIEFVALLALIACSRSCLFRLGPPALKRIVHMAQSNTVCLLLLFWFGILSLRANENNVSDSINSPFLCSFSVHFLQTVFVHEKGSPQFEVQF